MGTEKETHSNAESKIVGDVETIDPRGDLLWEKSPGVNEPQGLVPPYEKPAHKHEDTGEQPES